MEVKIIDFGFAVNNSRHLKAFGGTQNYMSPEIIEQKPFDGFKADIFSLGVILFISVFGKFPFSRAEKDDKFYKLLHTPAL